MVINARATINLRLMVLEVQENSQTTY